MVQKCTIYWYIYDCYSETYLEALRPLENIQSLCEIYSTNSVDKLLKDSNKLLITDYSLQK